MLRDRNKKQTKAEEEEAVLLSSHLYENYGDLLLEGIVALAPDPPSLEEETEAASPTVMPQSELPEYQKPVFLPRFGIYGTSEEETIPLSELPPVKPSESIGNIPVAKPLPLSESIRLKQETDISLGVIRDLPVSGSPLMTIDKDPESGQTVETELPKTEESSDSGCIYTTPSGSQIYVPPYNPKIPEKTPDYEVSEAIYEKEKAVAEKRLTKMQKVYGVPDIYDQFCYYVLITHTMQYPQTGSQRMLRMCDRQYTWTDESDRSERFPEQGSVCPCCGKKIFVTHAEIEE